MMEFMVEFPVQFDAQVFLFTDMLLITRACKKSPNQLVIAKAVSSCNSNSLKHILESRDKNNYTSTAWLVM